MVRGGFISDLVVLRTISDGIICRTTRPCTLSGGIAFGLGQSGRECSDSLVDLIELFAHVLRQIAYVIGIVAAAAFEPRQLRPYLGRLGRWGRRRDMIAHGDEGFHYRNVHLNSRLASQYGGEHRNAMFGKGVWKECFRASYYGCRHRLRRYPAPLRVREPEHELVGKTPHVTFYGLVQGAGRNLV